MLPIATDNGARLAAIVPTGLAALARGLGADPEEVLERALGASHRPRLAVGPPVPESLPALRSLVLVVVDGLGHANLRARAGHARALGRLDGRRIETVLPSTTGAALTTLTTGRLPGEHGLIGYRIRHPELGLVTTLTDWQGIERSSEWQRADPLFPLAPALGVRPVAIGRPSHASGGLTHAILRGAEYHGGATIEDRFSAAEALLRDGEPVLAYLYIDELDRAAHQFGWESEPWLRALERLDAALDVLIQRLPPGTGIAVTADHGMVDVPVPERRTLDADPALMAGVAEVGGEPRLRSLYLHPGADPVEIAARFAAAEGARAWVGTRDEAIDAGWFGPTGPEVAQRLGDVLVAARRSVAYVLRDDPPRALAMVGQHGSLTAEERGVPLLLGGALAGSGFGAAVTEIARTRVARPPAGA